MARVYDTAALTPALCLKGIPKEVTHAGFDSKGTCLLTGNTAAYTTTSPVYGPVRAYTSTTPHPTF